jgi:hypothetical protein
MHFWKVSNVKKVRTHCKKRKKMDSGHQEKIFHLPSPVGHWISTFATRKCAFLESVQSEKSEDTLIKEKNDGIWSPRTFSPPTQSCGPLILNLWHFITTRKYVLLESVQSEKM